MGETNREYWLEMLEMLPIIVHISLAAMSNGQKVVELLQATVMSLLVILV
ncbi:hypothetical protein T4B_15535 [Trichinella pseudospiralis]|uniref:Uncharacterized protein n=2 Tax=Trichinella pseudospiralis TaxID=6337 RepID=A0A0V1FAP6_TRIPS|nr:hypothetical protein T4A_4172 [Trichinella pseudospiralis]KRY83184.1 hypothetical protein T4D_13016 [Trichinella pseudospiralis]KRZ23501.1 hypothetical protein T4B_15535 [Trichinella pseudospiralis]KRZ29420.1 hypothetical protein T4C_12658 [Trichinella pseudospiralis]